MDNKDFTDKLGNLPPDLFVEFAKALSSINREGQSTNNWVVATADVSITMDYEQLKLPFVENGLIRCNDVVRLYLGCVT